jgi:hypothetical protein
MSITTHALDVGALSPFFMSFWRTREINGILRKSFWC